MDVKMDMVLAAMGMEMGTEYGYRRLNGNYAGK